MKSISLLLLSLAPIALGHESPVSHQHAEVSMLEVAVSTGSIILLALGAVRYFMKSRE